MKRVMLLSAGLLLVPLLVSLLLAQAPSTTQAPPAPPTYTLTDLGPMQLTAAPSGATALNGSGQVTGFNQVPSLGATRAFLWNNGTISDLGTLGGAAGFGYGINAAGQIVGTADLLVTAGVNTERAFIWQNGAMTNLGDPNPAANNSEAFGINSAGDVAGYEVGTDFFIRPMIWKGGTHAGATVLTPLACPFPVCQGKALAINDLGQAAGWNYVMPSGIHPVMWDSNGQPTDLGTFGGSLHQANALNKNGVVVGYSQLDPNVAPSTVHAFRWENGVLLDLGTIPGIDPGFNGSDTNSAAWGINSKDDIVGISAGGQNPATLGIGGRAFLYSGGTMYDLSGLLAPGTNWKLESAWAINDNGQIVGVGFNPAGIEHGYLLTPITLATTTTLVSSISPSVYGQQVSFAATVNPTSSSSLTPTGNVTFNDGSNVLGIVALSSGTAILNTSALTVGIHSITASYAGDSSFALSTSTALRQTVNQGTTTTTVAAASDRVCNPSSGICAVGQSVTLTATVTPVAPASGTPTGTVNFLDGSTSLGSGTLSGGQATFTTSSLTSGMHSITTVYAGDTNFLTSTSSILSLAVKQTTTTTLTSSPNPSNTGQSVSLTATIIPVSANTSTPTGTVSFLDGTTALGTGTLTPLSCKLCTSATATLSTSSLTAGTHSLTASYGGDTNFASSTSSAVTQTVNLLITVNESITVTDAPAVLPSVMIPVNESIAVSDALAVLPSAIIQVIESISVLDRPSIPVFVTPTVTPIPAGVLTNVQRSGFFPHVSGDLACYVSRAFTTGTQVRFFDLLTQTDAIVPGSTNQVGDQMCDVKSSTIVVQRGGALLADFNSDLSSSILTFDAANLSVAPVQIVSNAGAQNIAPRIGEQTIIWQSRPYPKGGPSSIVTYDRVSSTTQTISSRFFPDGEAVMSSESPAISPDGQLAVWEGCTDSATPTCLTWQAILSNGMWTAQQLDSTVQGNQSHPDTDGSIIVYSSAVLQDQSQHLLVWQPVGGGNEQVLNLPGQYANPSVSSGLIAFAYEAPGKNYHNIALYDTVFNRFYNLTADLRPGDLSDNLLSDISVTADGKVRVVWQGTLPNAGGQPDLVMFAYTFQRVNTPAGSNVFVNPTDTTTGKTLAGVTFTNVSQAGITSLTTGSTGAPPPPGFQPGTPLVYYDISTSSAYTGPINICINFTGIVFPGSALPHFFHFENGAWVDHTLSVDTTNMIACGSVTSLSPFAVFQQAVIATTTSITAPSITYGTPASVVVSVGSSGGTVNGSVSLSVDGGPALSSALSNGSGVFSVGILNAGPHSLSASFAAQGNFSASSAAGTLTVAQAPLTVTANIATRPYGAANPAFSANSSGFVNGDTSSALTGLLTCATTAMSNSAVGMYPIVCTGLSSPNYVISFVNGMLNVVPETTSLAVTISPSTIAVGQSTTVTVTLTASDMLIPIDPSALASVAVTSPIVSDILTGNGACALAPAGVGMATCTVTLTAVEPNGRTLNASFPGTANLAASNNLANLIVTAPLESKVSCLKSDFRNVAVPGGSYLWLNSIFKIRDVNKQKVTITFFQSSVQFQYTDASKNLITVNQALPDAKITIDHSVSTASTMYDAVDNVWITTVPFDLDDATFLTGIPWLVPAGGIPADIEPVTWCGTFASDTAGVDMGWRWSAAAYSSFSGDNNVLGVKPMNTDHDNPPANRDNAGTPENFKPSVIPGARGKGGKNYTGSYSGSAEIE